MICDVNEDPRTVTFSVYNKDRCISSGRSPPLFISPIRVITPGTICVVSRVSCRSSMDWERPFLPPLRFFGTRHSLQSPLRPFVSSLLGLLFRPKPPSVPNPPYKDVFLVVVGFGTLILIVRSFLVGR